MAVRIRHDRGRQLIGAALVITGMLMIFLCLPVQLFMIILGVLLALIGFALLR